jgi:hypothetical protein
LVIPAIFVQSLSSTGLYFQSIQDRFLPRPFYFIIHYLLTLQKLQMKLLAPSLNKPQIFLQNKVVIVLREIISAEALAAYSTDFAGK